MRKDLLTSAAFGLLAAPVASAETPLAIVATMAADGAAHVTIDGATFVLPDQQEAMSAALKARTDKDRPVVIQVQGKIAAPYRVVGGILYLAQSAGFTQISVVNDPDGE